MSLKLENSISLMGIFSLTLIGLFFGTIVNVPLFLIGVVALFLIQFVPKLEPFDISELESSAFEANLAMPFQSNPALEKLQGNFMIAFIVSSLLIYGISFILWQTAPIWFHPIPIAILAIFLLTLTLKLNKRKKLPELVEPETSPAMSLPKINIQEVLLEKNTPTLLLYKNKSTKKMPSRSMNYLQGNSRQSLYPKSHKKK